MAHMLKQRIIPRSTVVAVVGVMLTGLAQSAAGTTLQGIPVGLEDIAGAPPKNEQAKVALHELRTLEGKIRSEHE